MEINFVCEVCKSEPALGVASSSLGPISQAFGKNCLQQQAEELSLIHFTIWSCGGSDKVADWLKGYKSFKDGKYIEWDEIVKIYEEINYAKEMDSMIADMEVQEEQENYGI